MGKHLLLLGGGHAHLTVMANLGEYAAAGHRVTLVSPADYHYYSGMGPGMLSGLYTPQQCRFNVLAMAGKGGAEYIRSSLVSLDPGAKTALLADGATVSYDVCSLNTGSHVPHTLSGLGRTGVFAVKPIDNLLAARKLLQTLMAQGGSPKVLVAGGGPAGFELAGNAWALLSAGGVKEPSVTIAPGRQLLGRFPEKVRRLARASLTRRGITVLEGLGVSGLEEGHAVLSDGGHAPYDVAFLATGVVPQPDVAQFGIAAGPKGGLLVDRYLRSTSHPGIFGGGDCISFAPQELDKVGVYPVRQNPVIHHNLLAALGGRELQEFTGTHPEYLLILNGGDGRAILRRGGLVYEGRTAMWIKDRIDRSFMKKFQINGELEEKE